jgi:hypothetical protein
MKLQMLKRLKLNMSMKLCEVCLSFILVSQVLQMSKTLGMSKTNFGVKLLSISKKFIQTLAVMRRGTEVDNRKGGLRV